MLDKLFTIFRTDKETDKTVIVGQVKDKPIPQLSQQVKQVTGEKPSSAMKTENTVTFDTPSYKVDFVDKEILKIGGVETTGGVIDE